MAAASLNLTALAVAPQVIDCGDGYVAHLRRNKVLRERVAYMLWSAAHHAA